MKIWDHIGQGFAKVATVAAKAAVWSSEHPEVLNTIGTIATAAGAPGAAVMGAEAGARVVGAVVAAKHRDETK